MSFWLRILNVYPNEWWVVKRLYLLQFFQGAGIAFLFTSAFAQFLEKFPITELPWVMVCSAVLLWVTGFVYTKLEHKIPFGRFNIMIIVFMASSMIVLWVVNHTVSGNWFLYLIMAWFNVLYLLNNLEFWGIAALLFDLRQSKRLFGVISAGDIPAKFIGYSLALIFVPLTGTKNLLLIGAGCMLSSLPFFIGIIKSGKLEMAHQPDHHTHKKSNNAQKHISKLVLNIVTNSFIRRIAFISLITSTCVILINYGFYGEVKKAYQDDVALASFIAFFYASIRIVAFITKMVFTSRLTAYLGIRPALFITPVGMLTLVIVITAVNSLSSDQTMIFYLFGVASIVVEVLRTSFNSPVLLSLMQPLPKHERLRAHNIIKGIMDPFASFLSGAFLLVLFYLHDKVDLMFLCYVLAFLGALWIVGVIFVNRQYLGILMKTIGNRYFTRDDFDLGDESVMQHVRYKMMTGTDIEVINILRMLNSKKIDTVAEVLIGQLLQHSSDQVKIESLHLINGTNFSHAKEIIQSLINDGVSNVVKTEAIKTFGKIAENNWELDAYLHHPQEDIRHAAITGMLGNADSFIKAKAEAAISGMLTAGKKDDKEKALSILHEVKDEYSHSGHLQMIHDADRNIQLIAIRAIGKASGVDTVRALFTHISSREKQVLDALYNAGETAIPLIREYIADITTTGNLKEKLLLLCGKIGGDKARGILLVLLRKETRHTAVIIRALYKCKYTTDAAGQKEFETIARSYIINAVELLHMQHGLSKKSQDYELLHNSLQQELMNISEILLNLFGCMYDRDKMNQVKYGLAASKKDSVANAMEIIELTVKKDIGRQFNTMFESTSIEHRCTSLRSLFTEKQFDEIEPILERILSEKPIQYYNWTKACTMYISKKYIHPLETGMYKKYVTSENVLLKETALFAAPTSYL